MIGKVKRFTIITLLACLILVLATARFLSSRQNANGKSGSFDANFTLHALRQAKRDEISRTHNYELTAIVVNWRRFSGVKRAVRYYLSTELFKEIIVWNNNPEIDLTINHILTNHPQAHQVRIINSKKNLKDEAKYRACAQAQTLACFYADDDWNLSGYIRSLIASFRADPTVLHTATDAMTYYNNMLSTFMDRQIDLHTGFTWIGTGSVFLREHAQRHLYFLETHLKSNPELWVFSDVFFSLWLNDIPSQLIVNLIPLITNRNEMKNSLSFAAEHDDLQKVASILAIRKLEYSLRLNQAHIDGTFPRHQSRRFPYLVKSPSFKDDFIFINNVLPVDIERIPFDISIHAGRATFGNIPNSLNYTHFLLYNTLKVMDKDESTCWYPPRPVRKGDFFAVDLLSIQAHVTVTFFLRHSETLQNSLDMRLSFDGVQWISYRSFKGIYQTLPNLFSASSYRLLIDSRQFPALLHSFRYMAFNATEDSEESFQICSIEVIKNSAVIPH